MSKSNYPTQANSGLVWATLSAPGCMGHPVNSRGARPLPRYYWTGVVSGLPFSTKKETSNFTGVVPLFCPE